jgi:hypothetical protein
MEPERRSLPGQNSNRQTDHRSRPSSRARSRHAGGLGRCLNDTRALRGRVFWGRVHCRRPSFCFWPGAAQALVAPTRRRSTLLRTRRSARGASPGCAERACAGSGGASTGSSGGARHHACDSRGVCSQWFVYTGEWTNAAQSEHPDPFDRLPAGLSELERRRHRRRASVRRRSERPELQHGHPVCIALGPSTRQRCRLSRARLAARAGAVSCWDGCRICSNRLGKATPRPCRG